MSGKIEVLGYSSVIISIWFLSGIIITIIGVTGVYIGKIFDQTKNRQPFIIEEIIKNAPNGNYEIGVVIGTYLPFVVLVLIAYLVYYKAKNRKDLND